MQRTDSLGAVETSLKFFEAMFPTMFAIPEQVAPLPLLVDDDFRQLLTPRRR